LRGDSIQTLAKAKTPGVIAFKNKYLTRQSRGTHGLTLASRAFYHVEVTPLLTATRGQLSRPLDSIVSNTERSSRRLGETKDETLKTSTRRTPDVVWREILAFCYFCADRFLRLPFACPVRAH